MRSASAMLSLDIRSGDYTIDTQKGSVYLIGSARSQAELERATRSARYIPGVTRVVTYIELRPGAPVAQQPTPSVAPARSSTGSQSPQVPERGHDHRGWMDDGRRRKPGAKHDDRHPS